MGQVIAVIKFIMGQVITAIKSIIMSPGLCDTSITWVPIGRPPSPPATVDERDEDDEVLYLPQECALCLEAMHLDDKTIAMLGNDDSTLPTYYSKVYRYWDLLTSRYPKRTTVNPTPYKAFGLRQHGDTRGVHYLSSDYAGDAEAGFVASRNPSGNQRKKLEYRHCQVHKLDEIETWERGQPPAKTDSASEFKITKLTIDRHGIRKIESLSERPQYEYGRSETRAYVFIDPSQAKQCRFQFKLDIARLSFDSDGPDFPQIWDTPTPPFKGLSLSPRTSGCLDPRFRIVDLRNTTGLTFFYYHHSLLRIHSHTAKSPTALETYRRLSKTGYTNLVWAYVPISPSDPIREFGIRQYEEPYYEDSARWSISSKPTVMIRTELLDDIILGPSDDSLTMSHVFELTPHLLVYTEPNALRYVTYGAVGEPDPTVRYGNPMPALSDFTGHRNLRYAIKAHVPLDGAVRVDVFSSHTGSCKGIVL
ncbi:uncharacterized protein FIESC28_04172 [Fusarium coffeatum]|uniref:Uncharacterized protein n=1 Tax=Fusarium coffeatum TaxID=231269 RepID=A0A366S146_9HYPO|nr:uncharacterized protein FIESC28_04172 [Fusarium coffeatum]RBR23033.1 hypothetical protein FIESC28_04172 [Fusarium coffeatum]